jgi:hypothetical protein
VIGSTSGGGNLFAKDDAANIINTDNRVKTFFILSPFI